MIIKPQMFTSPDAGNYALSTRDASQRIRPVLPSVVHGSPRFLHEITSMVSWKLRLFGLTFSFEESALAVRPLWRQVGRLFRGVWFAGYHPAEIARLEVWHADKARGEVHMYVSNCDLQSGRRMDLFTNRRDWKQIVALQEAINQLFEFSSPCSVETRRMVRVDWSRVNARNRPQVQQIERNMQRLVSSSRISDQRALISALAERGMKTICSDESSITVSTAAGEIRLVGPVCCEEAGILEIPDWLENETVDPLSELLRLRTIRLTINRRSSGRDLDAGEPASEEEIIALAHERLEWRNELTGTGTDRTHERTDRTHERTDGTSRSPSERAKKCDHGDQTKREQPAEPRESLAIRIAALSSAIGKDSDEMRRRVTRPEQPSGTFNGIKGLA